MSGSLRYFRFIWFRSAGTFFQALLALLALPLIWFWFNRDHTTAVGFLLSLFLLAQSQDFLQISLALSMGLRRRDCFRGILLAIVFPATLAGLFLHILAPRLFFWCFPLFWFDAGIVGAHVSLSGSSGGKSRIIAYLLLIVPLMIAFYVALGTQEAAFFLVFPLGFAILYLLVGLLILENRLQDYCVR